MAFLPTLTSLFLAAAGPPDGAGLHAPLDALLRAHVKEGVVDYRALKSREKDLDRYLETLARTEPAPLAEKERLALWINAYNAFTLKLILERYPGIKGIKDIPRRWDLKRWTVGGKTYSLGQIEHEVLRKEFREPRIHFAIVCAARSCPDLRSEAYLGERIDEQLTEAGRRFLSLPDKGFKALREPGLLFGTNDNVYLSSIFKWFAEDFERDGKTVIDFLLPHLPPAGRKFVEEHRKDLSLRYLDYDWSLNGS
jgi:hypothetical protein